MTGAERIAAERQRQIEQEGWTPEHDRRGHHPWMLLAAARCYAQPPETRHMGHAAPMGWPWEIRWWKPKGRLRDLERAGALAQAVIDLQDERDGQSCSRLPASLFADAAVLRDWCAVEVDKLGEA